MTGQFYGPPHLHGLTGLPKRIALRLSSREIVEPITSAQMRCNFAGDLKRYKEALRELEIRNCIHLEKRMNKRGRPSVLVKINPQMLTQEALKLIKSME